MIRFTAPQSERLAKLADKLEALPPRYKHFDMSVFFGDRGTEAERNYALHNGGVDACGTIACALGHGPAAGILVPKSMVKPHRGYSQVDWDAYATLFTGDRMGETPRAEQARAVWCWLFDCDWAETDGHHYAAAARIRYLLAGNDLPAKFDRTRPAQRRYLKLYRPYHKRHSVPAL